MKAFISRNKSVFVIGFITLLVFLAIIVLSERRQGSGSYIQPKLVPIDQGIDTGNTSPFKTTKLQQESTPSEDFFNTSAPAEAVQSTQSIADAKVDQTYGTLKVEWTSNGFSPKNAKAILGQKVLWKNLTDKNIFIMQKTLFFNNFASPQVVPSNGEFEFRLYKEGIWSYEEKGSKITGSIFIIKP